MAEVLGKVSIRTATLDDLPELDAHTPIPHLRSCDHTGYIADANYAFLVATTSGRLCGHVNIRWRGFRLEPFATEYPGIAVMNTLGVWPESMRNQKIGTAMVDDVERIVSERKVRHVGLGFYAENRDVERFYERRGYRRITPEPVLDYESLTDYIIIMVKELA